VGCLSACAVHRPNGTRARNVPSRIAPAPLRNRQIAFGCGRFPVRSISHRCVPLRGRWAARLARARGGFRRASTPPPRIRLHPRWAIHPPLRRAWLGRDASLRQSHPSRRCLAHRGVGFALAPWQARLAPCALLAHVRFCGARSAHLTRSKVSTLHLNCAESCLAIQFADPCRMAILMGHNNGSEYAKAT